MSMWWLRLRGLFSRENAVKEPKGLGPRPGGKGTGAKTGAGKTAAGSEGRGGCSFYWLPAMAMVVLFLHLSLFPPIPRLSVDFPAAGEIAQKEIRAPFSFKAPLLDRDVQMARLEKVLVEPPVLVRHTETNQGMQLWLEALAGALADSSASRARKIDLLALRFPSINRGELVRLFTAVEPDSLVPRMERAWRRVMTAGVVDMLPTGKYSRVVIKDDNHETLVDRDKLVVQDDVEKRLTAELRRVGLGPIEAVESAALIRHFVQPNLLYAADETRHRQELARQTVPTRKEISAGERIVDQGVRVTEQQARFLAALGEKLQERGGGGDGADRASRFFSRGLLVILALLLYGWLAYIHYPERMGQIRFLVTQTVILALFLLGASFALERPGLGPMAVPIVLLSLLTTVLYRDKVGYTTTLLAISLLTLLPDVGSGSFFAWFILGMITVISVRRIQKRSQFYQTILLLTGLSVLLIFLMSVGHNAGGLGGGYWVGLFAPVLLVAFGLFLLPVVEPLVGVCSDLTLLELSDLNHPLLQRMALEAQGTYHHSQVVGQLAEHAARAIDANALLTRVGALFHDIGKMEKSEYYVENQRPEYNKHDELSPSMSALVIAAHVKEGIELARRWRLPQRVIDFIPEHHGTMVMEYFYHKALEDEGNETVKVDDFRYPGPKPRSRETAILMLADAVEAATRSLAKPTPSRIKEITKQIIDKRMLSGELDESGLTLSDIARIREAFIPLLTGIHHARIVYPGQKEKDVEKVPERRGDKKART